MSRTKGALSISAAFEPQAAMPFDARAVTQTRADLLLTATWQANDGNPYAYVGMLVSVIADPTPENNGVYRLKAADYTLLSNWELLGSGGGGGGGVSSYTVQEYAILNSLMFG